jgi:hypothetical protein
MKRQVPVGLLYRWMYPTVNPYSGGVGVCSFGVLGQLAFFSNQHYSLSSQIPCSVLRAFIHEHVRTFGTMTADLLALRDWLTAQGVTQVAMESTGVYWKPIYYVLEEAFTCLLVNAAHMRNVPGRKTDVQDCVWIAQLLEHGLLRGSFVPPVPIRELRDLTRYRKGLIQERVRETQRLQKVLEDAG